jgi:hypothetical protein
MLMKRATVSGKAVRRGLLAMALLAAAQLAAVMLLPSGSALANGGPLYEPAEGYGPLRLEHSDSIALLREKVSFAIPDRDSVYVGPDPEVTVDYELHNGSEAPKSVEMLFLFPSGGGMKVMENGNKAISPKEASEDSLKGLIGRPSVRPVLMEPFSGQPLANRSSQASVRGSRFVLEFRAGETKQVRISYPDRGGWEERGVVNPVGSHLYYLSPASYWAGEPKIELEVRLEDRSSRLYSNLPLKLEEPGLYRASLGKLPEEEWMFSHASGRRLLFPLNRQPEYNQLLFGTVAVGTILTGLLAYRTRRLWIAAAAGAGWIGIMLRYITDVGGYPFEIILLPFAYGITAAVQIIVFVIVRSKLSRRAWARKHQLPPE